MRQVLSVILVLIVVCAAYSPLFSQNVEHHWKEFTLKYQKHYATAQESTLRFAIFKANLAQIDSLNQNDPSASFGINKFSDLSSEEFAGTYLMPSFESKFSFEKYEPVQSKGEAVPDSFDWRSKGAVTPVKDQGQCGSCWAFSATEEIESQWLLKGNPAVFLAPQQIVDCDKKDAGCGGGDTPTAYEYVISAGGIEPESLYPYKAKDQKCAFNLTKAAVSISGWKYVVKAKNETEMLDALFTAGPLSICVDAETWQHYDKGIITKNCKAHLDHCVELVGFGKDNDLTSGEVIPFWNVRNSWGTDWGEDGYIRVQRDQKNLCGIASEVTVAII